MPEEEKIRLKRKVWWVINHKSVKTKKELKERQISLRHEEKEENA